MLPGRPRRARLAGFVVLATLALPAGAAITARVDHAFHVTPLAPEGAAWYPLGLVLLRFAAALLLAWLVARLVRAHATVGAAGSLLGTLGRRDAHPRLRLGSPFSPRVWAASFALTSTAYLLSAEVLGVAGPEGRWPLLAPWLHTYALPVFAVLSVLVALAWGVLGWVREIEEYAARVLDRVGRILGATLSPVRRRPGRPDDEAAPRRRFGLAFESRPPPLLA